MNPKPYALRLACENDVRAVTLLIHNAYDIWRPTGLSLGPMFQAEAQTAERLLGGKGYVLESFAKEIVGTFSVEDGLIAKTPVEEIAFTQGTNPTAYFAPIGRMEDFPSSKFLVFRRVAIHPDYSGKGLGKRLYDAAENLARKRNCPGVILETVQEAVWLFEWYLRIGFQVIGKRRYPGRPLDTILMIKRFER